MLTWSHANNRTSRQASFFLKRQFGIERRVQFFGLFPRAPALFVRGRNFRALFLGRGQRRHDFIVLPEKHDFPVSIFHVHTSSISHGYGAQPYGKAHGVRRPSASGLGLRAARRILGLVRDEGMFRIAPLGSNKGMGLSRMRACAYANMQDCSDMYVLTCETGQGEHVARIPDRETTHSESGRRDHPPARRPQGRRILPAQGHRDPAGPAEQQAAGRGRPRWRGAGAL